MTNVIARNMKTGQKVEGILVEKDNKTVTFLDSNGADFSFPWAGSQIIISTKEFEDACQEKADKLYNSKMGFNYEVEQNFGDGIIKFVWQAFNRDQFLVWDMKNNCKADLRTKEYKERI